MPGFTPAEEENLKPQSKKQTLPPPRRKNLQSIQEQEPRQRSMEIDPQSDSQNSRNANESTKPEGSVSVQVEVHVHPVAETLSQPEPSSSNHEPEQPQSRQPLGSMATGGDQTQANTLSIMIPQTQSKRRLTPIDQGTVSKDTNGPSANENRQIGLAADRAALPPIVKDEEPAMQPASTSTQLPQLIEEESPASPPEGTNLT